MSNSYIKKSCNSLFLFISLFESKDILIYWHAPGYRRRFVSVASNSWQPLGADSKIISLDNAQLHLDVFFFQPLLLRQECDACVTHSRVGVSSRIIFLTEAWQLISPPGELNARHPPPTRWRDADVAPSPCRGSIKHKTHEWIMRSADGRAMNTKNSPGEK